MTATCTGSTSNQGDGAPGSSAGTDGYGTGIETGVTVNVGSGASNRVTGSITGGQFGILTLSEEILGGEHRSAQVAPKTHAFANLCATVPMFPAPAPRRRPSF